MAKRERQAVCVIYGFCEGPRLAEPLLRLLQQAGYAITDNPQEANIVIGHSGGCFLVPEATPAPRIIMVGLPYWPGKSTFRALVQKNRAEIHSYYREHHLSGWLRKFSWNLVYFWKFSANLRMLRAQQRGTFWHTRNLVIVRNREDLCCTPAITAAPFRHSPAFIALPGHHDDLWLHPQDYVAIN
jgi:hypothetical protein